MASWLCHFRLQASYDMAAAWDGRLRKWYGDRYDFKGNMVRDGSNMYRQLWDAGKVSIELADMSSWAAMSCCGCYILLWPRLLFEHTTGSLSMLLLLLPPVVVVVGGDVYPLLVVT
jgi:hypothetical protein